MSFPPGDKGLPLFGNSFALLKSPSTYFVRQHNKYGGIFMAKFFGVKQPVISIKDPEILEFAFQNEGTLFRSFFPGTFKAIIGEDIIAYQQGDKHLSRRKILQKAINRKSVGNKIDVIKAITERHLESWISDRLIWYPRIRSYSFDLACKLLIGMDDAWKTQLGEHYRILSDGLFSLPINLPWSKYGRAINSSRFLGSEIQAFIDTSEPYSCELIDILKSSQDVDGKPISKDEITQQIVSILFAGHGTLASAMTSCCLLLGLHPDYLKKCESEIEGISDDFSLEDLENLVYTRHLMKETLRMYPPIGLVFRKVLQDCNYSKYTFQKDWNVLLQINYTQNDERLFNSPHVFEPDRFSDSKNICPYSYVPFGAGKRECLGKDVVEIELMVFLVLLIKGYRWVIEDDQNLDMALTSIEMRPKDNLIVEFCRK